jgi:hypothetical protein
MPFDPTVEHEAQARAQGVGEPHAYRQLIREHRALLSAVSPGYVRCPPLAPVEAKPAPQAVLIPGEPGAAPIEDDGA